MKKSKGTYCVCWQKRIVFIDKNAAAYFDFFLNWIYSTCVPVGITGSAVRIKICAIIAGIKMYNSIKKKKKKHDKLCC